MCYSRPSSCDVVFAAAVVLFAFFKHRTFIVLQWTELRWLWLATLLCVFVMFGLDHLSYLMKCFCNVLPAVKLTPVQLCAQLLGQDSRRLRGM